MNWKLVVSYVISILLVAAILLFVDINKVIEGVIGFGVEQFVVLMILVVISFVLRAVLWKELLGPFGKVSFSDSFHINNIGFLVNNILPLRIGEIVKAVLIGKKYSIGKVKAFSTVVVNRILEGFVLVLFFIAGMLIAPSIGSEIKNVMILPAIAFLLMLGLFVFPDVYLKISEKIVKGISPNLYEKTKNMLKDIIVGEKAFRQGWKANAAIILSTIGVWGVVAGLYYLTALRFGLNMGIGELLVITAFTSLVTIIPSAPGFIGTFQAGFIFVFLAMGFGAEEATAVSIVIQLAFLVATSILGLISLHMTGIKMQEITSLRKAE
jgi:hypothetical protein